MAEGRSGTIGERWEELQRQATFKRVRQVLQPVLPDPRGPAQIQITTTRCRLARMGNGWRKQEEPILVKGYREELVEGGAHPMIQISIEPRG